MNDSIVMPTPNRAERRERSVKRFRQTRLRVGGKIDQWEWKPTQKHPRTRRAKNRCKSVLAKASRKANR